MKLFWIHGYSATSIQQLCKVMDLVIGGIFLRKILKLFLTVKGRISFLADDYFDSMMLTIDFNSEDGSITQQF